MNDRELLKRIHVDRQRGSRAVVYLEGTGDPELFFALLGVRRPVSDTHDDVYVIGLKSGGSGAMAVRARIDAAQAEGLTDVFGIIDGDGRDLATLEAEFDAPFSGPLFSWKTYCIENLLAKGAWPNAWGSEPDWCNALKQYAPYAALNRVHRALQADLETLGLHRFRNPQMGEPLETVASISAALGQDKALIAGRDVQAEFDNEVVALQNAIATSLDEGHTRINGKWLCRHYAPTVVNQTEQECRETWTAAVLAAGGLAEVRNWWQRITGKTP